PAVPLAAWKSISVRRAGRSSAPPGCIGVTIATKLPVSIENNLGKAPFYPNRSGQGTAARPEIGTSARGSILRRSSLSWQQRRPAASAPDGRDALHDRRPRGAYQALLEGNDGQSLAQKRKQFVGGQQMLRIGRAAIGFVAGRECLVQERAAAIQQVEQLGEQRAVQIVGDDDRIELQARQRPRPAFEIRGDRRYSRHTGERDKRQAVAIDGDDVAKAGGKESAVPALSASEIEHARPRRDQRRKARDPGRWRSVNRCIGHRLVRRGLRAGLGSPLTSRALSAAASSISQSMNACASGRNAEIVPRTMK